MKLKIVLTAIFLLVNYMFAQDNDYIYINFSKSGMFQVCNFVIIDGNTVKTESYEIFKGDMIFKDFHFTGWQKRNKLSTEKIIALGDSFYIGKLKFSKDLIINDNDCDKFKKWYNKFGELSNKKRLNLCRNVVYLESISYKYLNNIYAIIKDTEMIILPIDQFKYELTINEKIEKDVKK